MNLSFCLPIYFASGVNMNILDIRHFSKEHRQKYWHYQIELLRKVYQLRENLNIDNYENSLVKFMDMNEGSYLYPYYCSADLLSIGYGLALVHKDCSTNFFPLACQAFKYINRSLPHYDQLKDFADKKIALISAEEAKELLLFVLREKRKELCRILNFFLALPLNVQITIESLYYHNPIFVIGDVEQQLLDFKFSNFSNQSCLENILYIICRKSNRGAPYEGSKPTINYWFGIQYRRYREMLMCSNNLIDSKHFLVMHQALNKFSL